MTAPYATTRTIDPTGGSDLPSTPRPEVVAAAPDIMLIRDLLAGTRRMHEQYKVYIPKWAGEKDANYKKRATIAAVFGGLARSLSASVGLLYAKQPQKSDTWTDDIEEQFENIDGKGTHGFVFAKRRSEDAIADGLAAILVDFAKAPADVLVTAANEKQLNLRPIWSGYQRSDIVSWDTAVIENVETVVRVNLREPTSKKVGKYGIQRGIQYRILTLQVTPAADPTKPPTRVAMWRVEEERKDANGKVTVVVTDPGGPFLDASGLPLREIPLAVGYAGRTDAFFTAIPPLLDLAWANLEHWRIASDLRWYETLCAFPQPTIEGELAPTGLTTQDGSTVPPKFQMGPTVLVQLTPNSKFSFTEVSGKSLQQLQASRDAKKDDMGELGASFLRKIQRGVETAEAKRIDAAAENATLATAATGIEDMLNEALRFHCLYLGIDPEQAPTLTLNSDFEGTVLDPQVMVAYSTLVKDNGLPARVLLEALQAGGRIPPDEDLDALALEMAANASAIAKQAADAAKAKLAPANQDQNPMDTAS